MGDVREISVDFARTIAGELRADVERYFTVDRFGSVGFDLKLRQAGEDMIERYVRRAIEKDRSERAAWVTGSVP